MDPDLPFYYHTSNERFSAAVLPSFDEAPADCSDSDDDDDDDDDDVYAVLFEIQGRIHRYLLLGAHFSQPETEHPLDNGFIVLMLGYHLFHKDK